MKTRLVSPVVATILILVITVALTGALLLFLMNWTNNAVNIENMPKTYLIDIREEWVEAKKINTNTLNLKFNLYNAGDSIPPDEQMIITIKEGNSVVNRTIGEIGSICNFTDYLKKGELADCEVNITQGVSGINSGDTIDLEISLANSNTVRLTVTVG